MPTTERLAAWCRVFMLGLPGFGRSDKPERALAVPDLADSAAAWLSEMGLERAAGRAGAGPVEQDAAARAAAARARAGLLAGQAGPVDRRAGIR